MPKFCSKPFNTITILDKGDVLPCFCPGWHSYGSVGNLNTHTLTEIFNNRKTNEFRNTIFDQSFKYCLKDGCTELWNLPEVESLNKSYNSPELPTTINLMIEKNCNLKCSMCRNNLIWSKEANPQTEKILDILAQDYKNFNEPVWIQCDTLGDIFASTAYKNFFERDDIPKCFQFNLSTNGNLITKNLNLIEKIKSQIYSVCVSFDAATSETYKVVRGGKFEILIDGIKAMQSIGILRINASFVIQQQNYKEVLYFYYLCKDLGINQISFGEVTRLPHQSDEWWDQNQIRNNPRVDHNYLIDALTFIKQDSPQTTLCGRLEYLISTKSTSKLN
jgi:Iron-sulfur cluster-binding domain/Radical SAM superfamily